MVVARLPPELLHEIVICSSASEAAALASLSLSCRFFHSEVQPRLYHTIDAQVLWPPRIYHYEKTDRTAKSFTPTDLGIKEYTSRYLSFLRAIVNHPHLAKLVRAFISCDDDRLDSSRTQFWPLLTRALSEMSNLKTLVFHHSKRSAPSCVLEDCQPALECFSWQCIITEWDVSRQFLIQQRRLRVLHLYAGGTSAEPVADFLVPHLTTFVGELRAIEAFCLDRPVTSLFWLPDRDQSDFMGLSPRYVPLLNRLHTLEIETNFLDEYLLLMVLELTSLERLNVIGYVPPPELILQIRTLTHLKVSGPPSFIVWNPLFWDGEKRDEYVQSCFESHPSLHIVDVMKFRLGFHRYIQGQSKLEITTKGVFEWCPVPYHWKQLFRQANFLNVMFTS